MAPSRRSGNNDNNNNENPDIAAIIRNNCKPFFLRLSLKNQKVRYAASSLVNKALTWWNTQVQARGHEAAMAMTWNDFKALMVEGILPRFHELATRGDLGKGLNDKRKYGESGSSRRIVGKDKQEGTFSLNDHFVNVLFDSGADFSFISTEFAPLLNVRPSIVNLGYVIEVTDGKRVEVDRIIRDCKLAGVARQGFHTT
ncbi:putative reverse transcriptase domain-containing protein [Tanacetum coccineum]